MSVETLSVETLSEVEPNLVRGRLGALFGELNGALDELFAVPGSVVADADLAGVLVELPGGP